MGVSKTHGHKVAHDAINKYIQADKPKTGKTGKSTKVAKTHKADVDKIQGKPTVKPQVIGDNTEGVLDKPIRMRYGIMPKPTEPDDSAPIKMKYGIIPRPPVDDGDAPIKMRYGIMPRPRD